MIDRDRMKAFLDDLALVSAKHGIFLLPGKDKTIIALDPSGDPTPTAGYFANPHHPDQHWWIVDCDDGCEDCKLAVKAVTSVDVCIITATSASP